MGVRTQAMLHLFLWSMQAKAFHALKFHMSVRWSARYHAAVEASGHANHDFVFCGLSASLGTGQALELSLVYLGCHCRGLCLWMVVRSMCTCARAESSHEWQFTERRWRFAYPSLGSC